MQGVTGIIQMVNSSLLGHVVAALYRSVCTHGTPSMVATLSAHTFCPVQITLTRSCTKEPLVLTRQPIFNSTMIL